MNCFGRILIAPPVAFAVPADVTDITNYNDTRSTSTTISSWGSTTIPPPPPPVEKPPPVCTITIFPHQHHRHQHHQQNQDYRHQHHHHLHKSNGFLGVCYTGDPSPPTLADEQVMHRFSSTTATSTPNHCLLLNHHTKCSTGTTFMVLILVLHHRLIHRKDHEMRTDGLPVLKLPFVPPPPPPFTVVLSNHGCSSITTHYHQC